MPIDPDLAVGAQLGEREFSWSPSDVLLYHLGIGAGGDPLDPGELKYVLEDGLQVLPTFAVVAPNLRETAPPEVSMPGVDVDLAATLHGRQELTVHAPIPAAGEATASSRIADVQDKGKAAVIITENHATDESGQPLFTTRSSIFVRGEGGFGGHRGESERVELPDREPDAVVDVPTLPQQALWYRLCGDRNPLHADPSFAAAAGFERPILHGLCTYGLVCKSLVDSLLDGSPAAVGGFSARFAGVVHPGETIRTRAWTEPGRVLAQSSAVERDAAVLSDAVLTTA
jgi:acyl dehydratase